MKKLPWIVNSAQSFYYKSTAIYSWWAKVETLCFKVLLFYWYDGHGKKKQGSQPAVWLSWCFTALRHYNSPGLSHKDFWYLIIKHIHIHTVIFRLSLGFTADAQKGLTVWDKCCVEWRRHSFTSSIRATHGLPANMMIKEPCTYGPCTHMYTPTLSKRVLFV